MDIFIIVLSLIIIGAVIFMTHYQNDKQKKEQKDPLVDIQNQRKDIVAQALKGLNCECKWQTEDDEEVAIFEFQSGHFSIRIKKDTPYVDLLFLFFYNNINIISSYKNNLITFNFHKIN